MRKFSFLLPSEALPTSSPAGLNPGLQRTRMELARRGSLGRSFDNKCAHDHTTSGMALGHRAAAR